MGKFTHRSKSSGGGGTVSRSAKQQISDTPLKMRVEDGRSGFYRLANDDAVDPGIKVTTNISIS